MRELNPRVSPELDGLIARLLALATEERFSGHARLAAEALEQAAHRASSLAARPLFEWGHHQSACVRSPEAVQLTAQRDATARQELERREAGKKTRAATLLEQPRRSAFAPAWAAAGAVALLVLVLVLVTMRGPRREPQAGAGLGFREDRSVSLGDSATSPSTVMAPESQGGKAPKLARPLPEKPFPGQRQPPCNPRTEVVLRGVCWAVLEAKPPCGDTAYEWEGRCYLPSIPPGRQPTSNPPQ